MKCFIFLLAAGTGFCAFGQAPQWGNLTPGPYKVGYTAIRTYDYSRSYFEGETLEERARPIQLYVWYPADPATGAPSMRYGDYFDDLGYDLGKPREADQWKQYLSQEFKTGPLQPSFPQGIPEDTFQKILRTPIPCFRNAQAVQDRFPLLLHMHVNGAVSQSVMLEYLASHGYVVVSLSMLGSSPAFYGRGEWGVNTQMALTQDLAFALAYARTLPYADVNNAAMIGMIAQIGMSLQMRDMPLKAIACLDCNLNYQQLSELPYFDPRKVRIPLLELVNSEYNDPQAGSFLDSLPYATRYIGRFQGMRHADFYPFQNVAHPELAGRYENYEKNARFALQFLDAYVKNMVDVRLLLAASPGKNEFAPGNLSMRVEAAHSPMPTESEFLNWLRYGEMEKLRAAMAQDAKIPAAQDKFFNVLMFLRRDRAPQAYEASLWYVDAFPGDYRMVGILNDWGYYFLQNGQPEKALAQFKLFVQYLPESPYAYDGLADAYVALGDKKNAELASQKVLALLEKATLPPQEKEGLRKSVADRLKALE